MKLKLLAVKAMVGLGFAMATIFNGPFNWSVLLHSELFVEGMVFMLGGCIILSMLSNQSPAVL